MISGDYRQQELRVMAHLSQDGQLCGILREKGDPFLLIAAAWHDLPPHEVCNLFSSLAFSLSCEHCSSLAGMKNGCLDGLKNLSMQLTYKGIEACHNNPQSRYLRLVAVNTFLSANIEVIIK